MFPWYHLFAYMSIHLSGNTCFSNYKWFLIINTSSEYFLSRISKRLVIYFCFISANRLIKSLFELFDDNVKFVKNMSKTYD